GRIVRNTNALEMSARTMRVEVELDNRDGSLLPGMYASVVLSLARQHPVFVVASSALIVDQSGARLAIVRNNHVHYTQIVIGRDMGEEAEILDGIDSTNEIVNN